MEPHAYPDLWQRTLSLIQKSHYYDKETFDSWISKTELFKIENGKSGYYHGLPPVLETISFMVYS